jgi:glycosyl-4,4'-diaponeurosporenoate acyltransferase
VRLIRLSRPRTVLLDVAAWGLIHAATGYAAHRLPAARLQRDGWLLRPRPFEADGRLYARTLRIRRWKGLVPEAGALFAGGISKAHLPDAATGGLERFVVETRRAELAHWWAAAAAPLFALWNPAGVVPLHLAYGVAANLPCIAIQRYNRLRATRVLVGRAGSTRRSSTASVGRDDARLVPRRSGSSIP